MNNDKIMINENICDYYETHGDIELDPTKIDWCVENDCPCENIPFDECLVKAVEYCKLKDKQLKDKEAKHEEYNQVLDEINSIVKHWYENEWSCYKCRINMDRQLKKILGLIRNLRGKK